MVLFFYSKHVRILTLLLVTFVLFHIEMAVAIEKDMLKGKKFLGIDYKNDLLKVSVENVSLKEVIADVSKKVGIKIINNFSVEDEMTVSFDYLPLERGLKQLLKGYNYVLIYSPEEEDNVKDPSSLMTIYIFSKLERNAKEGLHDARQVMNMNELQNKLNGRLHEIFSSQGLDQSSVLQKIQIEEAFSKINAVGWDDKLKNVENKDLQSLDTVKKDIIDKINNAINMVTTETHSVNDKE